METLMGNLALLAALLGRVAVLPETICDQLQLGKGETGQCNIPCYMTRHVTVTRLLT